jgi:uncharacterized iron-regulated protein
MARSTHLRARRSAGQLHALENVERVIRAHDSHARRKYVQEFTRAFRAYESLLDENGVHELAREADVLLVGDYHALPIAQRYTATLFEACALAGQRPLILGLETIFSRDQHILNEWWRREISADELRTRIRFDRDWGYDWPPFYELLVAAREHGEAIYALDCMPREDLRKIGARDRHAAEKIAEIRARHPAAAIMVLFGESHLAPRHLPACLRQLLPSDRLLTVLQNVDALYWRVSGERQDHVPAVRVDQNTVCVFNATPLEKYENYRLCLERWRQDETGPDLVPTLYNLIEALARFFEIDRYSSSNGTQPRFLVDLLPEVYGPASLALFRRRIERHAFSTHDRSRIDRDLEDAACFYCPELNSIVARQFHMLEASETAARALHAASRGLPRMSHSASHFQGETSPSARDAFYRAVVEHALAYFGSRILHPARAPFRDSDIRDLYEVTHEDLERQTQLPFATAMRALESLTRHRDFELAAPAGDSADDSEDAQQTLYPRLPDEALRLVAHRLGLLAGCDLYDAYLDGRVTPGSARSILVTDLEDPGSAPRAYFDLVQRLRAIRRKARAASAGR